MRGSSVDVRETGRPSRFTPWVLVAAALGAIIRVLYVERFPTKGLLYPGGDGFDYHLMALHLADGEGYVNGLGPPGEAAHHPPGWITLLAGATKLGARSPIAHQRIGIGIGVLLIIVTACLAACIFGRRTGIVAGFLAAVYPGFWVLEAQIVAEPLALVLLGVSLLLVARLVESPSMRVAILLGVSIGIGILVRSEQAAVFAIVIPFALARAPDLTTMRRVQLGAVVAAIVLGFLAPWAAYNATRFEEPVLLSSGLGDTLLAGNCDTYSGELIGFYDTRCSLRIALREKPADRSVMDGLARAAAIDNIGKNFDRLPLTMLARVGRTTGLYAPRQTVERVAQWQGTSEWPVWLWVVSYWPLAALATYGLVLARRSGVWLLPLIAPVLVVIGIVLVFYGEPRYHTPADVTVVVLAAHCLARLPDRQPEPPLAAVS